MDENAIPITHRKAKLRREEDDWIVMSPSGKMLAVNDSAKKVIDLSDGTRSFGDIAQIIARSGNADATQVSEELWQATKGLEKAGVLQVHSAEYVPPKIEVISSSGRKPLDDYDADHFAGFVSADPPCQM
jgi:hypothetical protein